MTRAWRAFRERIAVAFMLTTLAVELPLLPFRIVWMGRSRKPHATAWPWL